jgi:hypothetical protein
MPLGAKHMTVWQTLVIRLTTAVNHESVECIRTELQYWDRTKRQRQNNLQQPFETNATPRTKQLSEKRENRHGTSVADNSKRLRTIYPIIHPSSAYE